MPLKRIRLESMPLKRIRLESMPLKRIGLNVHENCPCVSERRSVLDLRHQMCQNTAPKVKDRQPLLEVHTVTCSPRTCTAIFAQGPCQAVFARMRFSHTNHKVILASHRLIAGINRFFLPAIFLHNWSRCLMQSRMRMGFSSLYKILAAHRLFPGTNETLLRSPLTRAKLNLT